jgi:perosamine synthetase
MNSFKRRLSLKQLFSKGNSDIFNYLPPVDDYFFTDSGRGGLAAIIELIWKMEPVKVMLPVFVAEGVIEPFFDKNISAVFYKLKEDLSPDIEDITKKINADPSIKCFVAIHYFGFEQKLDKIKNLCDHNHILLFEDCAHALFSKNENNNYLGIIGDISFFSLSKILPVPDGAIFLINNPKLIWLKDKLHYKKSIKGYLMVWSHVLFLLVKNLEFKFDFSFPFKLLNYFSQKLYEIYYSLLRSMPKPQKVSSFTLRILKNLDYDQLISKRQKNIKQIYDILEPANNLLFLKRPPEGTLLTGVPLVSSERERQTSDLLQNNIECLSYFRYWFFFPENNNNEFQFESVFHQQHFLLPVHEENKDFSDDLKKLIDNNS